MPVDWAVLIFTAGAVCGLVGRPLLVRLFKLALGFRREVEEIKKEAEKE